MLVDDAAGRDARPEAPRWLAGAFATLLVLVFALLVLGPLVRAHGAGLACPDWPLCFGELVPPMNLHVGLEWSHRLVAGSVSLLFAALAAVAWRRSEPGDAVRRAIVFASALLGVQILLGALTIWRLLASWTVTSHLLTGHAFAAGVAWIALELRDRARTLPPAPRPAAAVRWVLGIALALLALQLFLGGLVSSRYAGLACPEWPTCRSGLWFPTWRGAEGLHLLHRTNGYLLVAALVLLAACARRERRLGGLGRLAAALGVLQMGVGVANVLAGIPVELTGLHSALATSLVLTGTAAAHEAWGRRASSASPEADSRPGSARARRTPAAGRSQSAG